MFTPRRNCSPWTLLYDFGVYVIALLLADAEVAEVATPMEAAQKSLRFAIDAERVAYEKRARARAMVAAAVFRMTRMVRRFELALLSFVDKQRDSDRYRLFFPDGLRKFNRLPVRMRVERLRDMKNLLNRGEGPADRASWSAQIAEHLLAVKARQDAFEDADRGHRESRSAVWLAQGAWVDAYRSTHAELDRRMPRDPERVESYFFRPHEEEEDAADAATDAVAAPATDATPSPASTPEADPATGKGSVA